MLGRRRRGVPSEMGSEQLSSISPSVAPDSAASQRRGRAAAASTSEAAGGAPRIEDLSSPELYLNRELSWLAFEFRILDEAKNRKNPLLERLKFLAITASNLDEFLRFFASSRMRNSNA